MSKKKVVLPSFATDQISPAAEIARQQKSSRGEKNIILKVVWVDNSRVMELGADITVQNAQQTIMTKFLVNEKKLGIYYPRGGIFLKAENAMNFYFGRPVKKGPRTAEIEIIELKKYKKSSGQLKIFCDGHARHLLETWPETNTTGSLLQLGVEISHNFVLTTLKPVIQLNPDTNIISELGTNGELMMCKSHSPNGDEDPMEDLMTFHHIPDQSTFKSKKAKRASQGREKKKKSKEDHFVDEVHRCQPPPTWFLASKEGESFVSTIKPGEKLKHTLRSNLITGVTKTNQNLILAGTIDGILLQLLDWVQIAPVAPDTFPTLAPGPDTKDVLEIMQVFIFTYKKFSTSSYILGLLRGFWEQSPNSGKQLQRRTAISYFLAKWFENQIVDFEFGPILAITQNWVKTMPSEYQTFLSEKLEDCFPKRQNPEKKKYVYSGMEEFFFKEPEKKLVLGEFGILDLKPEDFASHYSLMDMENFSAMTVEEFWDYHPENNFQKIISRGIKFSLWVASEILKETELLFRKKMICQLVEVAFYFLELDNFNALMWFWVGFKSSHVARLVSTLGSLPEATRNTITKLELICGDTKYGLLKQAASARLKEDKPVIPWFKQLDRSINRIETRYNDVVLHPAGGLPLLNFEKMWEYGEQVRFFNEYHDVVRNFALRTNFGPSTLVLREFIQTLTYLSEEDIQIYSFECEPQLPLT